MPRLFCLLLVLLGSACAGPGARAPAEAPAPTRASTASAPVSPLAEPEARRRVGEVAALVEQTRNLVGAWSGADASMARAQQALGTGAWAEALVASDQARAEAEAMISDHYVRLAAVELTRSLSYTGLDDARLAQLRAAEETLVTGNARLAYGRLRTLNGQLAQQVKPYAVAAGDSLWIISGKPEAYGNPWLWPLIWRANLDVVPNPNRLQRGQVLQLRAHPTVDEVVGAINEARGRQPGSTPSIGPIRPAPSPP